MLKNRGFVYLLCDGEKFKIGMTKQKDINKRIHELQTGNPNEIWLHSYYECDNPLRVEQMMHCKNNISHVKNEWFDLTVDQVLNFKKDCAWCDNALKALKDNPFI